MILALAPPRTAIDASPRAAAARVLVLGWLAFWLLAVVQPLCDAWAGDLHAPADGTGVHGASSGIPAEASPWQGEHPADPCCHSISSAALDDARPAALAPPGTTKLWSAPPQSVAIAFPPAPAHTLLWAAATPPPADASPLYLRTLRLRI